MPTPSSAPLRGGLTKMRCSCFYFLLNAKPRLWLAMLCLSSLMPLDPKLKHRTHPEALSPQTEPEPKTFRTSQTLYRRRDLHLGNQPGDDACTCLPKPTACYTDMHICEYICNHMHLHKGAHIYIYIHFSSYIYKYIYIYICFNRY